MNERRTALPIALSAILAVAPPRPSRPFTVTFVTDMRAEIAAMRFQPATDRVGVRGGVAPLAWETTLLATDPDGDGRYEASATFPSVPFGGQAVTYKYKMEHGADVAGGGWEDGRNRQLFCAKPD